MDLPDEQLTGSAAGERVPHEVLAKQLGISDKTVRVKRARGMTDQEIAEEAVVNSPKHDPLKRKREAAEAPAVEQMLIPLVEDDVQPDEYLTETRDLRIRQMRVSVELDELKVKKEQGRVVPLDVVVQHVSSAFRAVRDAVLSSADRLPPRLSGLTDKAEIRRVIVEDNEQSLSLARKCLDEYEAKLAALERGEGGSVSAAADQTERVGEPILLPES